MTIGPTSESWVVRARPNDRALVRLFCFPYAGGGASVFRQWPGALPSTIDVCAIQLPGRENRFGERPFTNLSVLSEAVIAAISPYCDRPIALFGHSMGALLAFDLACRMNGQPWPSYLFVSGHRAPHLSDPSPPLSDLPEEAFVAGLRQLSGTPEPVLSNSELLHLLMPMLRADFALCEAYRHHPRAPLACPISVFGGTGDVRVPRKHLAAWRRYTRSCFSLRMIAGDHFFLHNSAAWLLRAIADDLARVLI